MCGICGVVQIGGDSREVVPTEVLDRMTDAMAHRGPNDRGTYEGPGVALGVRRLSIVDVEGGHQPVSSEDERVWAIQNGELYNHDALREALRADGHVFQTRCDTEVLPHLYERFGPGFEARLRGKFAVAVWDVNQRRAVLARDRLGVKPLYYAIVGDLVVFASELKSLLASDLIGRTIDFEAVDAYLTFGYFPTPHTPLTGVSKLRPGHRLVIDERGVREEQYWAYPKPTLARPDRPVEEYAEGLLERLEDSVRARLMSDVSLGAMLSGGIDSSVVVALMARNMTEPVKTFSVAFAESGADNELQDARMVARTFGTDHHELELSLAEETLDLDDLVWHLDEPVSDLSSLGFLALSELASRHVTVALSGQGADELFGGYRKHVAAALAGAWERLPASAQKLGMRVARRGPARLKRPVRTLAAADPATRLLAMSGQFDGGLRAQLARGPLAELDGGAALRAVQASMNGLADDPLAATLYLDGQLALVDDMLHYFDRMSMAHSLEVRVPFLDHELVEYAATIPSAYKVHRLRTRKYVLKEAVRGLIPDAIIERRKIAFFENSARALFRAQLRGVVAEYLLDPNPRYAEFLDRDGVHGLVKQVNGSDGRNGKLLLSILLLEIWLRSFLDRVLGAPAPPARDPLVIAR
jgi:asparagine synthase (glutamine-hydrolysing)